VIVDLGTGDGRAALRLAVSEPSSLVLGVDPVASSMAETSRRAAKSAPNALFVAASAEAFAACLPSVADRMVVNFPWGSLLRGVLGADRRVAAAVGSIVAPSGRISALVSVTSRDGVPAVESLDAHAIAALVPPPGLTLVEACLATREEIRASRSTWGRKLLAAGGSARPVWRLEWRRGRSD
jgi:16S rRNA (adenine(1408)-N(1))-methyltransferase